MNSEKTHSVFVIAEKVKRPFWVDFCTIEETEETFYTVVKGRLDETSVLYRTKDLNKCDTFLARK